MGLFNKSNSGGLSRSERKERDALIRDAVEQKRREKANRPEVDAEDWNKAEEGLIEW